MTSKLKVVHANLWGPYDLSSQSGSTYTAILMYKHTRKLWALYLQRKDDFIDAFQLWLSQVKAEGRCSMKTLRADNGGEFILHKLQAFYEKKDISIKYTTPYMYKKNGLAKRRWRIIVIMKDSILINSRLPNGILGLNNGNS